MNLLEKLVSIANELDQKGLYVEASEIDKIAADLYQNIEPDTADEAMIIFELAKLLGANPTARVSVDLIKSLFAKKFPVSQYPEVRNIKNIKDIYKFVKRIVGQKPGISHKGPEPTTVTVNPF